MSLEAAPAPEPAPADWHHPHTPAIVVPCPSCELGLALTEPLEVLRCLHLPGGEHVLQVIPGRAGAT